ncbi:MAG: HAMP domain-containing histidine kinase [Kofleriaceae bacterium]|nr:HAMP domain-containing histidine kinase [Kofleriaceae bacterium]
MHRDLALLRTDSSPAVIAAVHRDLDLFDDAIERITTFDAAKGQRLGQEIERIRGQARGTTVLLDGISVALAVLASVLAVRQLQRAARDQEAALRLRDRREAELASQNEALGEFSGRVAHDILSPLSAAVLSLELIRQSTTDPPVLNKVERGASAIARVHRLVDDLLTFSRAGGHPEPGVSAPLASVLTDLVAELRALAQQQEIALELGPVPDGRIACSEGALTSMVSNLVRNAIKYMGNAPTRSIAVWVRDADKSWRIEVEDSGPGIPPQDQLRIFEPYVQLDKRASGIGLGLATVDRLVRAHGGRVGVISPAAMGRGSLFWFEVPKSFAENGANGRSAG